MNILTNYNFYKYSYQQPSNNKSFGSAQDINLRYILENRSYMIPERIQKEIKKYVDEGKENEISLRDLHLQTYSGLLDCKTLDEARNMYPEFREVLPYDSALKRGSKNTRRIEEHLSLDELPLYLLQARWGKLTTMIDIIKEFGLPGRYSIGWIMDKLRIPQFPQNYQLLLNASDEERNNMIAQKTKDFNKRHPEVILEHNRKISTNPKYKEMNRDLANGMWEQLPHVRLEMKYHRQEHPEYNYSEFDQTFWDSHPEYKEEMSKVRKEIAEARRNSPKKSDKK